MGIDRARSNVGRYQPYFDEGASLIRRGGEKFTDADMTGYMNPYIKGVLDPTAREIGEGTARQANRLDSMAGSMGAFGGSRAALMRSENYEKHNQAVSDLYARGMGDAWDRAVSLWGADRASSMAAGGQLIGLGEATQRADALDVNTLMATGATDRTLRQAMNDFDYQQFIENRDWDIRNLGGMLTALQGIHGSYTTTQTNTEEQKGDPLGTALGMAATIFGAIYGGPAGAAAGAALAGSLTGGGESESGGGFGSMDQGGLYDMASQNNYGSPFGGGSATTYPYGANPRTGSYTG
jgi:hypothetical protein